MRIVIQFNYIVIFTLAPWRVLGIDECGGASRRRSQAHATERKDRKTKSTGFPKKICDAKIFREEET